MAPLIDQSADIISFWIVVDALGKVHHKTFNFGANEFDVNMGFFTTGEFQQLMNQKKEVALLLFFGC
jgi:hypothetical protein